MRVQFASRHLLAIGLESRCGSRLCAAALLLVTTSAFAADPCQTAPAKELPPDALPEEVEAALVNELARSLRAFEECLPEVSALPTAGGSGGGRWQGGASGSGSGSGGASGSGAYRADDGQAYGEVTEGTGQGGGTGETYGGVSRPSSPITGGRAVADAARPQSQYEQDRNTPEGGERARGCGGTPCPDASSEDDVARKLRRAAEAEPDPGVRRQLWAQYHQYMNS